MRKAFAQILAELAHRDPRILLMTADLGFMALEPFANAHPDRFFNMGVAEQNMVGVATGLAEAGFLPYVYSIVNFAVMRPFEFIRNGPIAQKLPVRIVSVGGGMEYGHNGISHFGLEDVGLLRTQPGVAIVCPCDAPQARSAVAATWNLPSPVYLRLGKDETKEVPALNGKFELERAEVVEEGKDLLILALGPSVFEALQACRELRKSGINCTVLAVSSFGCGPHLLTFLARFPVALAVESHYANGGLGSWVCEMVAENGLACRVIRCAVAEHPGCVTGSQAFMEERHRISSEHLVKMALASRALQ